MTEKKMCFLNAHKNRRFSGTLLTNMFVVFFNSEKNGMPLNFNDQLYIYFSQFSDYLIHITQHRLKRTSISIVSVGCCKLMRNCFVIVSR